MVDLGWRSQGLLDAGRDTLFGAALVVETHGLVDAMEALVVDASLLLVQPAIALPEAPAGANPRVEHFIDRVNDRRIFRGPIHGFAIPVRTRQTDGTAGA